MIPQSFIQDLLARVDIVDVIEPYLPLKKGGANYFACCPFHGEKSPSFSVSPSKQFYHCFGCGAHGSAIGFLMEYTGLPFVEAVKELASRAGLQVPQEGGVGPRIEAGQNDALVDAMSRAARFYRDQLKHAPAAIAYLKRRGVSGEVAARFGIGYAPDDWQGLQKTFTEYDSKTLLDAGLVIENEAGRRYDRFRNRIIFPIQDRRGRVIAFGGRVLDGGEPKYLNSPETPLFEKGRELYGLTQAQKSIRDSGYALVVEGYMDVVALAQFDIGNAVATLGTATTPHHIHALLRHSQRIVFCFDGDAAGRKAAWRGLESALEALRDDVTLAFLFLPEQHDPDSFVRAEGSEAFRQAAAAATPLATFLLNELKASCPPDTAEGRARLVHEAKPLVTRIAAPMLRLQVIKAVAELGGFSQAEVERAFGLDLAAPTAASRVESGDRPAWRSGNAAARPPRGRRKPPSATATLLRLVLQHPVLAARLPVDLVPATNPEGEALVAIIDATSTGDLPANAGLGALVERFRETAHGEVLARCAGELVEAEFDDDIVETLFEDALRKLHADAIAREIEELTARERETGLSSTERRRLAALLMEKMKLVNVGKVKDF
ncbi:MAG: DNA primase [Aromatoleum sp.]|jgi:DNA primase|uniref:DNA primase n=1 Tax=Aromatoleum sp. TaxID=2307007 RepID=UPI002895BEEE|nr:DNA primase [Aromatoleum sp.]MDT3670721.1 DNA primase [Aromatoleum sp.]